MARKSFVLYVFLDQNKEPFYVGITGNFKKRMRKHMVEVHKMNRLYKYNKLRKVMSSGVKIEDIMVAVESNIPPYQICDKEIKFIKELRERGFKLTNLTDGGEGAINTIPGIGKRVRKAHLGKHLSDETKAKISLANKGKSFTQEHKKRLSIARRKRKTTLKTRLKMSRSSKGRINIKTYKLIDPYGNVYITQNGLTSFCEEHDLSHSNIIKVCNGERPMAKGWTACRIN